VRTQFYLLASLFLLGCATKQESIKPEPYQLKNSYLESVKDTAPEKETLNTDSIDTDELSSFSRLESIRQDGREEQRQQEMYKQFSKNKQLTMAADNMPLNQFLHYVFGELLGKNYVLGQALKDNTQPITLNIQESISESRLFALTSELLAQSQISIGFNEDVFFIQKSQLGKAKAVIGIGSTLNSVPTTAGQILQVIPIEYGIKISLERTIRELIDGTIRADFEQSALFVIGDRANILRAIELVDMLDVPANKGKNIGLISLTYVPVDSFIADAAVLLGNEGLPVGINKEPNRSVSFVPLNNIGAVAVFANSQNILDRVNYWVKILDKPAKGDSQQYFVYNPRFARATDLGDSIGSLLTLGRSMPIAKRSETSTGNAADKLNVEDVKAKKVISGGAVAFVVDERSNSIIFSTTGSEYQILLPLLEKLDVLPKQVILEVMIAEVTLSGDFKFGVEFALNQNSDFSLSTLGSFGAGATGGLNLSYLNGDSSLTASFFKQNQYINVLSNPTILVRDGVEANIRVGTDIPIQGGIVSDNGVTQTSFEYRRTGVEVSVTPTINAQGVVIMNITQDISNEVDTSNTSGGNPAIFERSLSTEAVVASGQTVILGGLISENTSNSDTRVPFFGDIPILGNLFKGKNDSTTKTELVMLVTPRVIYNGDQWQKLMSDFQNGLKNIRIVE
jgi:general secretion pathway protein D